uniref:Large ribosomal subunit protein uL18c n=1 Tax=Dictyopteris divaricata TaxID=156996 RepID=A0A2I4Q2I8_9PHAE|nr:50S ribosomal protein L18 [Dictyopteris divaricata]YP_010205346.1 50S ribosomal protein L18 [Grateloupia livida]AQZ25057.1 50S ribosomal protein L18 [Dictyopteris divaricata]UAV85915.1 50S ribosomal protein L18 [Grateloupia livida]
MGKRDKKIIKGTGSKPRLAVYRSNNHIYAQVIDDSCSKTMLSCSTLDVQIKIKCQKTANKIASKMVGEIIGTKLLEKDIQEIIFDRGKRPYHGRIKELAEGARFVGVKF